MQGRRSEEIKKKWQLLSRDDGQRQIVAPIQGNDSRMWGGVKICYYFGFFLTCSCLQNKQLYLPLHNSKYDFIGFFWKEPVNNTNDHPDLFLKRFSTPPPVQSTRLVQEESYGFFSCLPSYIFYWHRLRWYFSCLDWGTYQALWTKSKSYLFMTHVIFWSKWNISVLRGWRGFGI